MRSPGVILITGGTGFIGFRIITRALQTGYHVKAVARSLEKAATISTNLRVEGHVDKGSLKLVIIPDFASYRAWEEALCDVDYIIHAAFPLPLPSLDPEKDIWQPSIKITDVLLEAVIKAKTIKRVVITSSIVATMPRPPRNSGPYSADTRFPVPGGPFNDVYDAYQASKMHLLELSHQIGASAEANFDIINIFPSYTFGRNELAMTAKDMFTSSNALLLALLKGRVFESKRTAGAAHIDDVADVHVRALHDSIPGNQDYGISMPVAFNDAVQIAQKHFPRGFEDGLFTTSGDQPSEMVEWDASKTEAVFGLRFKSFEAMVVDVVEQYLEKLGENAFT